MKRFVSVLLLTAVLFSAFPVSAYARGNIFTKAWDAVSGAAESAWDATTEFAEDAWDATTGAVGTAWDATTGAVETAWDATTGAVETAWDATTGAVETAWDATTGAVVTAWDATTGAVVTAWDATTGAVGTAWNATTNAVGVAWDATTGAVVIAWDATTGAVVTAWGATTGAVVTAWNWTGNLVVTTGNAIGSMITAIRTDALDALLEAYNITAQNLGVDQATANKIWNFAMEYAAAHEIRKEDVAKLTMASLMQVMANPERGEDIAGEVIAFIYNGGITNQAAADAAVDSLEESLLAATEIPQLDPNELKYFMGEVVNTGVDNGFTGNQKITKDDPHFGWKLGEFFVSGYTRVTEDKDGNPVFLKTVGDKVALWFRLDQDILCLNGNSSLTISSDSNGYDEYFGVPQTNFGKGTMIIRHRDFQNSAGAPQIYTDYLAGSLTIGADTTVQLFEEGDYEVALNYEIKNDKKRTSYTNYRIYFKFSVRNGNCMVFPFDVETGEELTNTALTENGFYLDLARSRYLDINVKRETLAEGAVGLTEDVRFNRPARDGDQYTAEGIYTITVSNRYTGQETVKKIYVGTNKLLMAHMMTGLSIEEIRGLIAKGATIASDGTIIRADGE